MLKPTFSGSGDVRETGKVYLERRNEVLSQALFAQ
jgi:hypothetical protein